MFLFISILSAALLGEAYLNTSHVLIYRVPLSEAGVNRTEFKYISCSYLSYSFDRRTENAIQFKYISCSYLSGYKLRCGCRSILFKYISCSYLSKIKKNHCGRYVYLNTSHVLIYQTSFRMEDFG